MSDVYSFRQGPTYRGADRQEMFDAALEQPLSITSTLLDQAKGGILESFGLGTAIRNTTLPEAAPVEPGITTDPGDRNLLHGRWETPDELASRRESMGALDENQYKTSPYYRENVPYDPGMTETRAAALAAADDARTVRQHYASKRPISAFIGNLGGQALDPINYIPVAGPAVKAAAVSRFGRFAGEVATSAADAAANTAIFGIGTAGERAKFGDDVSWQSTVSQIATAALIGSAFGALGGAIGRRVDARSMAEAEQRLGTLRTTQEARIAMNEGIDAIVRGEDIRLSPNSTGPMARVANDVALASGPFHTTPILDMPGKPTDNIGADASISVGDGPNRALYHGTMASFDSFDAKYLGKNTGDEAAKHGFFFTTDPEVAGTYATKKGFLGRTKQGIVKQVSVDLQNPYIVDMHGHGFSKTDVSMGLIAEGVAKKMPGYEKFDGVIFKNVDDGNIAAGTKGKVSDVYFVPDANKIRVVQPGEKSGSVAVDTTAARPEPAPEGIKQAEAAIAKPDDSKALADQYRVDPQTGSFAEEAEVAQLAAEGRLTETDVNTMAQAQADFETGDAYAEALKSVAGCLL